MRKKRLPPSTFNIDVEKIKSGYYSDKYFVRTREILLKDNLRKNVLMQVFPRDDCILCGIDEAIAILKTCSFGPLKIKALYDGEEAKANETVMTIEGNYSDFSHLETVYLGVMARATSIATATRRITKIAGNIPVLFFSARYDHYLNQPFDGYAAWIGGANAVSTDAQGDFYHAKGIGTMPHALIAAYDGDTVKAAIAFDKYMPKDVKRIVLVDFDNDCINTSLEVARVLGRRLWGVRFDTPEDMIDKSVSPDSPNPYGVCEELCFKAREIFDREGFDYLKIIVSSGFNEEKVRRFVESKVPVDGFGIGSVFFRRRIDFTADIVLVEGRHCAKAGRRYLPNPRLEEVD